MSSGDKMAPFLASAMAWICQIIFLCNATLIKTTYSTKVNEMSITCQQYEHNIKLEVTKWMIRWLKNWGTRFENPRIEHQVWRASMSPWHSGDYLQHLQQLVFTSLIGEHWMITPENKIFLSKLLENFVLNWNKTYSW